MSAIYLSIDGAISWAIVLYLLKNFNTISNDINQ